jgi:hypothetical protein
MSETQRGNVMAALPYTFRRNDMSTQIGIIGARVGRKQNNMGFLVSSWFCLVCNSMWNQYMPSPEASALHGRSGESRHVSVPHEIPRWRLSICPRSARAAALFSQKREILKTASDFGDWGEPRTILVCLCIQGFVMLIVAAYCWVV